MTVVDGFRVDAVRPVASMRPSEAGWLYFIQQGDGGPVKVGVARDPRQRLSRLQEGSPVELRLVAACPGAADLEAEFHAALREHRVRGEWFEPDAVFSYLDSRLLPGEDAQAPKGTAT